MAGSRKNYWRAVLKLLIAVLAAYIFFWAASGVKVDLDRIKRGLPAVGRIFKSMFPPDWSMAGRALEGMLQSFYIAVLGTTIGSVLAVPLGFLAARNVTVYRILSAFGKQVLNAIRTFPELILAVFFVASYGPGPMAGLMAVGVHSTGMLGKLYADIIEGIERGPVEAAVSAGGNSLEVMRYSILPQVLPEFIATSLYRFEINMRAASTLGLVGAGGIGVLLLQALQFRRWPIVGMSLVVIVAAVTLVDYASAYIRKSIV
ncbi:MAG TPA: phosphonate ABC transporter, permease protein PhnE [Firmicutes bacterium]|nr:phosphonate ABC transporter, permease protein PhnE [Bacillota bacterium]